MQRFNSLVIDAFYCPLAFVVFAHVGDVPLHHEEAFSLETLLFFKVISKNVIKSCPWLVGFCCWSLVSAPKHFEFGTELFEFVCELDFVYKTNRVDIFVVLVDDLNVCAGQAIDWQLQIGVVLALNEIIARRLCEAFSLCFLDVYLFINTLFLDSFL